MRNQSIKFFTLLLVLISLKLPASATSRKPSCGAKIATSHFQKTKSSSRFEKNYAIVMKAFFAKQEQTKQQELDSLDDSMQLALQLV